MNKKVAILTQAPVGTNYGSTIQTYALQVFLKKHNYEPTTIDRVRGDNHSFFKKKESILKSELKNIFTTELNITPRIFNKIFIEQFKFVKENISISKRIETDTDLNKHFKKENYDIVIVGSDQTWRPQYSPNIYNYFLDFLEDNKEITKVAYATSFGTSEWEFSDEETQRCKYLVQKIDAVSVREKSGIALCKQYLEIDPKWVLDPTMLLTKEDYLKVASQGKVPFRKGLFSYILDETKAISNTIDTVKSILNLATFTNQPLCRSNNCQGKKLEELIYPSVEGWIKAFDQADFVVTNSFHGTVFCIIFNKPFLTIVNKQRGASRFHSLLSEFKLEDRLVYEEDTHIESIVKSPVDFTFVNQRWEALKDESIEFLYKSLTK